MIRPPGMRGAAFAAAAEGDARTDEAARTRLSRRLGIDDHWAFPSQVHGAAVVEAVAPGHVGEADAVFTTRPGLPIAIATADCAPVVLEGPGVAAVVHAGWRGAVAGVVPAALGAIGDAGHEIVRGAVGPSIGPCCYEVGPEVAEHFGSNVATTRRGTVSVDLVAYLAEQLAGVELWTSDVCTHDSDEYNSYRQTGTQRRQIAVAWVPAD